MGKTFPLHRIVTAVTATGSDWILGRILDQALVRGGLGAGGGATVAVDATDGSVRRSKEIIAGATLYQDLLPRFQRGYRAASPFALGFLTPRAVRLGSGLQDRLIRMAAHAVFRGAALAVKRISQLGATR